MSFQSSTAPWVRITLKKKIKYIKKVAKKRKKALINLPKGPFRYDTSKPQNQGLGHPLPSPGNPSSIPIQRFHIADLRGCADCRG